MILFFSLFRDCRFFSFPPLTFLAYTLRKRLKIELKIVVRVPSMSKTENRRNVHQGNGKIKTESERKRNEKYFLATECIREREYRVMKIARVHVCCFLSTRKSHVRSSIFIRHFRCFCSKTLDFIPVLPMKNFLFQDVKDEM